MKNIYNLKSKICLLMLTVATAVNAQVASTYNFTQTSGSMDTLVGGHVLGTSTNDDNSFTTIAIGSGSNAFTFNYNGHAYNTISVNTNGYIRLGSAVITNTSVNVMSATGPDTVISALNLDLLGKPNSVLSYQVTNFAQPSNNYMTIEWRHYRKQVFGTITSDDYNFQIQLYNTTNVIKVIYGTMINDSVDATAQVGLKGNNNTDFNIRTTTSAWSASTAGGTNAATCTLSSTVVPASGQTYIWTPTTLGINDVALSNADVTVYPNPASQSIKISMNNASYRQLNIKIMDMEGKEVYSDVEGNVTGNFTKQISTENIAKGTYILILDGGGVPTTHKIIIH